MAVEDEHAADHQEAVIIFRASWRTYQKLLDNNHLRHRELYSAVAKDMTQRWTTEGFGLLDLGCGDAQYVVATLHRTGLVQYLGRYTGVDLCKDALEVAHENLNDLIKGAATGCSITLVQGDMVSFACEGAVGPFDTALTSFAAHHLKSPEEKGRFLAGVRRHLKPGGTLYIVDVFRRNGEERASWLERFLAYVKETWTSLEETEIQMNFVHITDHDYPEDVLTYERIALQAGFNAVEALVSDEKQLVGAIAVRA